MQSGSVFSLLSITLSKVILTSLNLEGKYFHQLDLRCIASIEEETHVNSNTLHEIMSSIYCLVFRVKAYTLFMYARGHMNALTADRFLC